MKAALPSSRIERGMSSARCAVSLPAAAAAIVLAVTMLFASGGCAWVGAALESLGGEATAKADTLQTPAVSEAAATAEAVPVNPVFTLFSAFIEDYNTASEGLLRAISSAEDISLSHTYAALCSSEAELAVIYSTVGMFGSDGMGWSGSFTGVYAGSGSMNSRGTFSYEFEDGRSLAGRISEGLICFGVGSEPLAEIPEEPTPPPTDAANDAGAATGEVSDTEPGAAVTESQPSEAPGSTQYSVPTSAPFTAWAGLWKDSSDGVAKRIALKRTANGWVGVVLEGSVLSIFDAEDGRLYFASGRAADYPLGYDPLSGLAEYAAELNITVYEYADGIILP